MGNMPRCSEIAGGWQPAGGWCLPSPRGITEQQALQVSGQTQRRRRQWERVAGRRLLGPSSLSADLEGSLDEARVARVAVAGQSRAAEPSDP